MDFGVLPPEVNSGRMYAGPGSGPMLSAALAWDGLAADLGSSAASYATEISGLTAEWQGASSTSMAAAGAAFTAWLNATANEAEQTAAQARSAAAAFEAAFVATVPPPVIVANRSLLIALIATNILGQNTAAIAATETHYAEMWAQDAAAMYGYANASAAATQMTPFTAPPQTTNSSGTAAPLASVAQATGGSVKSGLSQLVTAVPHALQSLALPTSTSTSATAGLQSGLSSLATLVTNLTGPYSPFAFTDVGGAPYLFGIQNVLIPQNGQGVATVLGGGVKALLPASLLPPAGSGIGALNPAGLSGSAVSGAVGHAGSVGALSVPKSWTTAAPVVRSVAEVVRDTGQGLTTAGAADSQRGLLSDVALSNLVGRVIGGATASPMGGSAPRGISGAVGAAAAPTTATIIVIPASGE